jgi:hypothetical protein
VILFLIYIVMWTKKLFDSCFLCAAFQNLTLHVTSRHVPHWSSYKILCVIAGVAIVNVALNVQHRLVLSLHPVLFIFSVFGSLFYFFILLLPFFYLFPTSSCIRNWPAGFVLLNSNMLTARNTQQHVGEVIFKYSIYSSFISGLCYPAIPPPS